MANEFLRKVPLFADLADADLDRLCSMIEEVQLPAGQTLFKEGEPGDRAYIIQEGQLEILKAATGREVLLAVRESGDVIGEGALLEEAPRMATARARSASRLLAIHKAQLDELVQTSASAARGMFFTVLGRWRSTSAMLRQSEKMAQLGTLTAGVAHELNNPAAAVKRGVAQLEEALAEQAAAERDLGRLGLAEDEGLQALGREVRLRAGRPTELEALDRSDKEAALEEWLDGRGVENTWSLAPQLAGLGYGVPELDGLAHTFGAARTGPVVRWLGATFSVQNRLAEIGQGASRISEIVKALKSYSYLDQAPVQEVDVHEGLDNTLIILRHKLKAGITVRREYASDLPKIAAWGSELNQVWTNILDNAADALGEGADRGGEIVIRTCREGDWVVVEIRDSGPGIPTEIIGRIFDPFFTTKPPGKGTGLGLDISYRIVAHKHGGDIKVYSRPGDTCFQVRLPLGTSTPASTAAAPVVESIPRAPDAELRRLLETTKTIAVVGISGRAGRPAHTVPAQMQARGYRIIPVNPHLGEVLGEKAYPDLSHVPHPVDTVMLFLPGEAVPPVVEQAIKKEAKAIWMQEGIVNEEAAHRARAAGLTVVMDRCMSRTWERLLGGSV